MTHSDSSSSRRISSWRRVSTPVCAAAVHRVRPYTRAARASGRPRSVRVSARGYGRGDDSDDHDDRNEDEDDDDRWCYDRGHGRGHRPADDGGDRDGTAASSADGRRVLSRLLASQVRVGHA